MRQLVSLALLTLVAAGGSTTQTADAQELASGIERGPRFLRASASRMERLDVSRTPVLARRLDVDFAGVSLREALTQLSRQAGLRLVYGDDVVPLGQRVELRAERITVAAALTDMLFDAGVDVVFDERGDAALVRRRPPVQNGVIVGRVTDAKTNTTITGATVVVEGTSRSATTGTDGRYRIAEVLPGTHTVRARYIGYTPAVAPVTVADGQEATADLALEKSVQKLDEVVTTGTVIPTEVKALPTPITVITAEDIERRKIQRVEQLFRGDVPGIVAFDQGAYDYYSTLRTRGTSTFGSSTMKTYVDGVEMSAGSYEAGLLDANAIEQIEIIRGPQASTLYGAEALDGVIQIFTKKGRLGLNRPEFIGKVSAGGIGGVPGQNTAFQTDNSLSMLGGSGNATYRLTGSLRRTGGWLPEYGSTDGALSLGTRITQGAFTLDASGEYTAKDFDFPRYLLPYPILAGSRYERWYRRQQVFGATVGYRATPMWQHSLTLGYNGAPGGYYKTRPTLVTPDDTLLYVFAYSMSRLSVLYHTDLRLPISRTVSATATAGVNYNSFAIDDNLTDGTSVNEGSLNGTSLFTDRLRSKDAGYFAQGQVSLAERLFLTGGVRAEHNDYFGPGIGLAWSPRVGASYVLPLGSTQVKVRAAYGDAIRAPQFGARGQAFDSYHMRLANPNLRPERQRGWDAGLELYGSQRASLGVTYYRQRAIDLVQEVTLIESTTRPTTQNQNVGLIVNQGVELEGRVGVGNLDLSGTFTVMNSTVGSLGPAYTGDLQVGDRLLIVPRTSAGATLTYAPWSGTTVTASMTYIGHYTNTDYRALYAYYFGGDPYRGSGRAYWIEYPTVTKLAVGLSQQVTKGLQAFVHAENVGNNLRPEGGDNTSYAAPRSVLVGATFRY